MHVAVVFNRLCNEGEALESSDFMRQEGDC